MSLIDGLVEFWTLNGTLRGAIAQSQLSTADGVKRYADGRVGEGWDVAGATGGRLVAATILDASTSFTYSIWVYPRTGSFNPAKGYIRWIGTPSAALQLRPDLAGNLEIVFGSQATGMDHPSAFAANAWHHVCVAWDAETATLTLWLDTVAKQSSPGITPPTAITANQYGSTLLSADAIIDAIGYWDRVLSDSEILELYNSGAGWEPSTFATVQINDGPNAGKYIVLKVS